MTQAPFVCRSKIWIEDRKGEVVFGLGRYRILESVQRTGSLNAAARELKMSYRAIWMRIRASEERMGQALVIREGNGSCLTPFARRLMVQFRQLLTQVEQESDQFYENLMSRSIGIADPPTGR